MRRELITQRDPKSPISEIFRTLRTNIQFMNMSKKRSSLLVTSTLPGEGKSWVASNLAITFAQAGKKVILVDADMRKGRQYAIFDVAPRPGLSNYLSGVDGNENHNMSSYIQETGIENLFVIPAGNVPPNPSELLITPDMIELLDNLNKIFDIVIVDGTPCQLVTDSVILSRLVDMTVIVTAHTQTKKDELESTIKSIQNVGGHIAGVVLNKIPVEAKKYNESYYYGSTANLQKNRKGSRKRKKSKLYKKDNEKIEQFKSDFEEIYSTNDIKEDYNADYNIKEEVELPKSLLHKNEDIPENTKTEETKESFVFQEVELSQKSSEYDQEKQEVDTRTQDILNQINDYLKNEKKDFKKKM